MENLNNFKTPSLTAKYVGGLYAEDECTNCLQIRMIEYILQDSFGRIVAQFCKACGLHKELYDGKKIEAYQETTLL